MEKYLLGIFLLYGLFGRISIADSNQYKLEYRAGGLLGNIKNLTDALGNATHYVVALTDTVKQKKSKDEITKALDALGYSLHHLTCSKEPTGNIPFFGGNFKPVLEDLEEGIDGLSDTKKIISQICNKECTKKKYHVDVNVKVNFYDAIAYCKKNNMILAAIESKDERKDVKEYLEKISGDKPGRFWSSGSKLGNGKTWKWLSTGKEISDLNWGEGEPNDSGGKQQCMELYVNYFKSGIYDDVECHYEYPAVCSTCA